jgi:hypothetical protein
MEYLLLILAILGVAALYFAPTIVAFSRKAPNRGSVLVLNLFLGWSFVGWVIALAMAARSRPSHVTVAVLPAGHPA